MRGSERDVAIDTCSGLVPAGPVVEAITAVPVLAVATNSSYDHAGGWHSFRERACHPLDADALRNPSCTVPIEEVFTSSYRRSAISRAASGAADQSTLSTFSSASGMTDLGTAIRIP